MFSCDLLNYKLLFSQEKICKFQSLEYFPISLYVYRAFLLKEIKKALNGHIHPALLRRNTCKGFHLSHQVLNFTFDLYQYLINLRDEHACLFQETCLVWDKVCVLYEFNTLTLTLLLAKFLKAFGIWKTWHVRISMSTIK